MAAAATSAKSKIYTSTRSSACVPAVAGTHDPGRGERVEALRRWLGDTWYHHCSQLLSWAEGSKTTPKGSKTTPSGGSVDDARAPH